MLGRDEHDGLVGRLYASALGEAPWQDMLQSISQSFGTTGSLIQISDSAGVMLGLATFPYPEEFSVRYFASEVCRSDPRFSYFARAVPNSIYYDRALFDVEEMNRDPRCRASNDAIGTKYSLGAHMGLPDGATAVVTLLSTDAEGEASPQAIKAFGRLAPHIRSALSLGQIVERRATTQLALLDALARRADGVILLDRNGAPSFMNDAARDILAAGDGIAFAAGAFATRRGPETRRLRKMIGDGIAFVAPSETLPSRELLVTRPRGQRPYLVRVLPAPPTERFLDHSGVACVMHIHDLAAVRVPPKPLLIAAFGFSEREADLAIALVRCANLAGAAVEAGMALNTARNHLQAIFRKSGTASQAEAIQLLSRLA